MVDEDAYCIDILTQVAAVQTALEQVAVNVLDGHVRALRRRRGGRPADRRPTRSSTS